MRETDVVVTALADSHDLIVVELAIRCGTNVVSVSDHPDVMLGLQNLDARAIDRGVTVVGGCGLSPGCTDILARHGASGFDSVDEIKIARAGAAGSAPGGPSLTIVDLGSGGETILPLTRPHEMIALSADGGSAYLSGGYLLAGGWDGISIVDLARGTVSELPVPDRPLGVVWLAG